MNVLGFLGDVLAVLVIALGLGLIVVGLIETLIKAIAKAVVYEIEARTKDGGK